MNEKRIIWLVIIGLSVALGFSLFWQSQARQNANNKYQSLAQSYDSLMTKYRSLRQITVDPNDLVIKATDTLNFGDQTYNFKNEFIRERLQNEISFLLDRKNFLIIAWLRSGRFFPLYETIFTSTNVTDNLKYVSGIESGFNVESISKAKAVGLWQFMEALAKAYNMKISTGYDSRRDPEESSKKSAMHWFYLYMRYGNWPLALAAYNLGETKVDEIMQRQKSKDFFKIMWPTETRRYVYFNFALKMIFEQTDRFLPGLITISKYQPYKIMAKVEIKITKKISIKDLANLANVELDQLINYNPAFIKDTLGPGLYKVNIPKY